MKQKNLILEYKKMSLVWFTDAQTENKVAINPAHVVAVFTAIEGQIGRAHV